MRQNFIGAPIKYAVHDSLSRIAFGIVFIRYFPAVHKAAAVKHIAAVIAVVYLYDIIHLYQSSLLLYAKGCFQIFSRVAFFAGGYLLGSTAYHHFTTVVAALGT